MSYNIANIFEGLNDEDIAILGYAVETFRDHVMEGEHLAKFVKRTLYIDKLLNEEYNKRKLDWKMFVRKDSI